MKTLNITKTRIFWIGKQMHRNDVNYRFVFSYQQFHFGPGLLGIPNFPQRMAEICVESCTR